MGFLKNLETNNQFPIVFIGSGITQRYFINAPTWDELLQKIWIETDSDKTYFSRYNELESIHSTDTFSIYTTLADELETNYNRQFYNGNITLSNLTPEEAHYNKVSPFRTKISEIFSDLKLNSDKSEELKLFKTMLSKARLIVTTNYDNFIEKQLNYSIKIRVGNTGLFEPAGDLNELYKIHGSIKHPNSIIITSKDYEKMNRTSAIVNAKILSLLTESPIIFFGYSLTDTNIQNLLTDLAENMPFSIEEASKRIGVVQYDKGNQCIKELMRSTSYGVHYTELSTDNYSKIYSTIANIDQGFSPLEISKYKNAFRQIIDVKGPQGELKQVLTSFVNLEQLPQELKRKNLVIAFGDNRYLYKFPDYVDYVKSYFLDKDSMPQEIAIKFILNTSPQSTLPISKYLEQGIHVNQEATTKINNRLAKFKSLESIQETVNYPIATGEQLNTYLESGLDAIRILEKDDHIKAKEKLAFFIKNINKIDSEALVQHILTSESDSFIKETNSRKLFMAHSLITETIIESI